MVDQQYVDALTLKKATIRDARRVGPLVRELVGDATNKQVIRRFRRLVLRPGYHVYLFLDGDRAIGVWIGREGYFLGADAPYLQMIALAVHPDLQGQGLGTKLGIKYLPELYGVSNFSQFWFITQHEHLHDFYSGLGFEQTGARFVYHGLGSGKPSLGRRIANRLGI